MKRKAQTLVNSLAAVTLALAMGTAEARAQSSLNLVYVESNIGSVLNMNSVLAFSNDGLGNLTPLASSPYLTGGTGVYAPHATGSEFDADQELIIRSDGSQLLAVNGDSNTIAVFNINSDGSLSAVSGSPFASHGQDPVSLGLADGILSGGAGSLTVINKNADPNQNNSGTTPNLVTYEMNSAGQLTVVSGSTINFAAGASPSQAEVVTSAHMVFVDQFMAGKLDSYKILANGKLSLVNEVTAPVTGAVILGEAHHPIQRAIYVCLPSLSEVGVYTYTSAGTLSFSHVVPNKGQAVCWMTVNAAGTFLYTAESNSGTVTVYSLTHYLTPTQVQHFTLSGTSAPTNLAFDPTGQFLYVLDTTYAKLHVLNVASNGTVSETTTPIVLNIPTGESPLGLATLMK